MGAETPWAAFRATGRGWSFRGLLLGSLLLHVAVLAIGRYLEPPPGPVAIPIQSPYGALNRAEVDVAVDAPQPPAALAPRAAEPADDLSDVEGDTATPPAAPPAEAAADSVVVAPKPAVAVKAPPAPPDPAPPSEPALPVEPPDAQGEPDGTDEARDDPRAASAEGEDWLSVDDQLDPAEPEPSPAASARATDPLMERLMAAERQKAQRREQLVPANSSAEKAVVAPAPPLRAAAAPAAARVVVVDVPVALTRWLSEQAPTNPHWQRMALGSSRTELSLSLSGGQLQHYDIERGASESMKQVLRGALFYVGKRHLPGGTVHPATGELRVVVETRVTPDGPSSTGEQLPAISHFTEADGSYLPKARVRLPSGRRIDIAVRLRP